MLPIHMYIIFYGKMATSNVIQGEIFPTHCLMYKYDLFSLLRLMSAIISKYLLIFEKAEIIFHIEKL